MLITKNRGKILSCTLPLDLFFRPAAHSLNHRCEEWVRAIFCRMLSYALKSGNIICQNAKTLKLAVIISLNAPALTAPRIQNTASAESKKVHNSFVPTAINSFSPHHDPLHNFLLPDADCRAWLSNNQPAPISFGEKKPASAGFILIWIDFPRAYCIVVPVFIFKRYFVVPKNDRYCQSIW